MIIECPHCQSRYEMNIELPPEGRKVRCANCSHVWIAEPGSEIDPEKDVKPEEPEEEEVEDDIDFREVSAKEEEAEPEEKKEEAAEPEETEEAAAGSDFEGMSEEDFFGGSQAEADAEDGLLDGEEEPAPPPPEQTPESRSTVMGWVGLLIFIAGIVSLSLLFRTNIVRALPGAAPIYAYLGMSVNVRGLKFRDVRYNWETASGRPKLSVRGTIVNITDQPVQVPTVVFIFIDDQGAELFHWAEKVIEGSVPGSKTSQFSVRIPAPPNAVRNLKIRFARKS